VPIYRSDAERSLTVDKANAIAAGLRAGGVRVHVDARDNLKPGPKYYEWERKGVPIRIEIGPRDIEKEQLMLVLRVTPGELQRKEPVPEAAVAAVVAARLDALQRGLLDEAMRRREASSHRGITDYDEMKRRIDEHGGFFYAGWCGSADCEQKVKEQTKATIRVLPLDEFASPERPARCIVCGSDATAEAVWARAY
jgi:prolyl-tRNA synthetase